MTSRSQIPPDRTAQGWDTYWRGTGDCAAWTAGGASHPALWAYWADFFQSVQGANATPSMIDIASGNGAVIGIALEHFAAKPGHVTCMDISAAAVANTVERFPTVHGLVGDARAMPLRSGTFDIVTSQFGVEYAGVAAISEAARLLAPGGRMALLMHHRDGSIQRECAASLGAILRLQKARFVPLAIELFRNGFAAVGGADRTPYELAATALAPAVAELEEIIAQYGEKVAGDTVVRLYSDVARIHDDLQHYDPDEVLAWLTRMELELDDYAVRMASMMDCALDQPSFEAICAQLSEQTTVGQAGPLLPPGHDSPIAWTVKVRGR